MEVILILDNIRSVHNVGSIFRTADAAGVSSIYLCGVTPAPIDRFGRSRKDLSKVALGAELTVNWLYFKKTEDAIKEAMSRGFKIVAVEQSENSISYKDLIKPEKAAYILGNEVGGISGEILDLAHYVVEIPMCGKKESLNVSVTAGIILFT